MLYKFSPMGYFGRVSQISRGPWFAELQVEDDGLEYYYVHADASGASRYLLSNNMSYKDRTELMHLWSAQYRVNAIGWGLGLFVSQQLITKNPRLIQLALGWKACAFLGLAGMTKVVVNQYYSRTYGPLIGAYFRKYQDVGATDAWEIRDRKREYYQIDDSQYMDYTEEDM